MSMEVNGSYGVNNRNSAYTLIREIRFLKIHGFPVFSKDSDVFTLLFVFTY